MKRYIKFLKFNEGSKDALNDPTNPKNWESRIKPGTKFIEGPEYKEYVKELKNITQTYILVVL